MDMFVEFNDYSNIREGVRALRAIIRANYPREYWRKADDERGYPNEFVNAAPKAGCLAGFIPGDYGGSVLSITEPSVIRGSQPALL